MTLTSMRSHRCPDWTPMLNQIVLCCSFQKFSTGIAQRILHQDFVIFTINRKLLVIPLRIYLRRSGIIVSIVKAIKLTLCVPLNIKSLSGTMWKVGSAQHTSLSWYKLGQPHFEFQRKWLHLLEFQNEAKWPTQWGGGVAHLLLFLSSPWILITLLWHKFLLSFKGKSGGPRHCIWTPDCPLKLSCYLALRGFQAHDFRIECFHGYWNSASRTPRYPLNGDCISL